MRNWFYSRKIATPHLPVVRGAAAAGMLKVGNRRNDGRRTEDGYTEEVAREMVMSRQSDGEQSGHLFRAIRPRGVIAAAAFLLAAVGWLDFVTGKDTSFTILYFGPCLNGGVVCRASRGISVLCVGGRVRIGGRVRFGAAKSHDRVLEDAGVKFGVLLLALCSLLDYVSSHSAGTNVLRSLHRRLAVGIGLAVSLTVIVAVSQWLFGGSQLNRGNHLQARVPSPGSTANYTYTSIPALNSSGSTTPVSTSKARRPLADLAILLTNCMRASRPVLLGSRIQTRPRACRLFAPAMCRVRCRTILAI